MKADPFSPLPTDISLTISLCRSGLCRYLDCLHPSSTPPMLAPPHSSSTVPLNIPPFDHQIYDRLKDQPLLR